MALKPQVSGNFQLIELVVFNYLIFLKGNLTVVAFEYCLIVGLHKRYHENMDIDVGYHYLTHDASGMMMTNSKFTSLFSGNSPAKIT